jgi:Ca2+-binding RTX toxin-like protein
MRLNYFGPTQEIFGEAFVTDGSFSPDVTAFSQTRIDLLNPDTEDETVLLGSGFATDSSGEPTDGTISDILFFSDGTQTATLTDISWPLTDFVAALDAIIEGDEAGPLAVLFSQGDEVRVDASTAVTGLDMREIGDVLELVTDPVVVAGSEFSDRVTGGAGDDDIAPGANDGADELRGSEGSDIYDFAGATSQSFYDLVYFEVDGPVSVNVDTSRGTGSIEKDSGTDTLVNLAEATGAADGGLAIFGSDGDDTFDTVHSAGEWLVLGSSFGNDTYNITLAGDNARLFFTREGSGEEAGPINVNIATGVAQDGFGFTDRINVSGAETGRIEIAATAGADTLVGSAFRESFIPLGGDDTVSGGAGFDRVRYDRSGIGAMEIDLGAGTASGTHDGVAFTDTLSSIEYVRGSREGDVIYGGAESELLQGRDGDDTLAGGFGDDTLDGGSGTDTAIFGFASTEVVATETEDGILIASSRGDDLFIDIETFAFTDASFSGEALIAAQGGGDTGGTPGELVTGTAGDDVLTGTENDDRVEGGAGNDDIDAGAGADGVLGQSGNDTLLGGGGNDNIAAADGNDVVDGGTGDDFIGGGLGNDSLLGGPGDDTLGGGQGDDTVLGNGGDDVIAGGPGDDAITGGAGADTIGGSFGFDTVSGGAGNDSLGGGFGQDELSGDDGNDAIGGGEGDDTVNGGTGNDFLAGGGRDDVVNGGAGADTINGGDGNDVLLGGTGADVFVWNAGEAGAVDVVGDFEDGLDSLLLVGVENAPGTGLAGKLAALEIADTTFDGEASAALSYDGQTIVLVGVTAADVSLDDIDFL